MRWAAGAVIAVALGIGGCEQPPKDLDEAVHKNDTRRIRQFIEKASPAEINAAVESVPYYCQSETLTLFLEHGADVNHRNTVNRTLLEDCLMRRQDEMTEQLLQKNARVDGDTVLMFPAEHGNLAQLKELLDKKADPNHVTDYGSTALTSAIGTAEERPHSLEMVQLLLDRGADPNQQLGPKMMHFYPIQRAVAANRLDIVELLLKHKARIDGYNDNKMTPLHQALFYDYKEVARVLIEHGAPLDVPDAQGRRPRTMTQDVALLKLMQKRK